MLVRLLQWLTPPFIRKKEPQDKPVILTRSEHTLSRKWISKEALKVLYRLHDAGYQAFLVGGGVRDVLLGHHPKDFDVVTNARPEEVYNLFRNSRMIGRRFRLVHVHFGAHIVEVATFRAGKDISEAQTIDLNLSRRTEGGMILRDNIYGTSVVEDVMRRDFTVNALYYNIADFSLIDYVGGLRDLASKTLRLIGDPDLRNKEDPLRMLRCIRFAAKLNFQIEKETEASIISLGHLIKNVPSARVFDEYLKLFLSGFAFESFKLLRKLGLFKMLFKPTDDVLCGRDFEGRFLDNAVHANDHAWMLPFIELSLKNTDQRVKEYKSVTPYFLLAVLLWPPVYVMFSHLKQQRKSQFIAMHEAIDLILHQQLNVFSIPRKMTHFIKEIWMLHFRMQKLHKNRIRSLYLHPKFRASLDFLRLRKEAGDSDAETSALWWDNYHSADEVTKHKMIDELSEKKPKSKRRHRRKKPKTSKLEPKD